MIDYESGGGPKIGEFGLKLSEDLSVALKECGYSFCRLTLRCQNDLLREPGRAWSEVACITTIGNRAHPTSPPTSSLRGLPDDAKVALAP
jgi:hypothetical protein